MAARMKLHTHLFLGKPRSYLITPEGSQCPIKLSDTRREQIAGTWRRIQASHRIGRSTGSIYAQPQ